VTLNLRSAFRFRNLRPQFAKGSFLLCPFRYCFLIWYTCVSWQNLYMHIKLLDSGVRVQVSKSATVVQKKLITSVSLQKLLSYLVRICIWTRPFHAHIKFVPLWPWPWTKGPCLDCKNLLCGYLRRLSVLANIFSYTVSTRTVPYTHSSYEHVCDSVVFGIFILPLGQK